MKNRLLITFMAAAVLFATGCGDLDFSLNNSKPITQETGDLKLNYAMGDLIKLGKYKGIDLHKSESSAVTDAQIISRMATKANVFKDTKFTTDNTEVIANGDIVNIDFEGFIDGAKESLDSTTAQGYVLGIGSGSFIEGFEEQLIGHKVGEEKFDINVKFPDTYGEASMAGKPARFEIKINGVVRDKDVAENTEVKTVSEWKEIIKTEIVEENDKNSKAALKTEAMRTVISFSLAKRFPDKLVQEYVNYLINDLYKPYAEQMGMEYDDLAEQMGLTDEKLNQDAQQYILSDMVITAIAKREGITVTAEELKAAKADRIGEGKVFSDEADYNSKNGDEKLLTELLSEKVQTFIVDNANIITVNAEEFNNLVNSGQVEEADDEDELELEEEEAEADEVEADAVDEE